MMKSHLKLGQELHGWTVEAVDTIEKIHRCVYQLKYKKNGASLVHISNKGSNKDTNNAFGIGFLTCPQDSSGVAHILEHLVLCGSKKFPVRDPFFSMLKRSLANFMNALTANDWTMYPFASQNPKDFYNLMDVYTDAVFFPLLKEESFRQEAHRLEQDKEKTIAQGVVFNEMKGAMSNPVDIMYRRTLKSVFPSITYHHNSGGEPLDILDLTLEQLREFHKIHYHPSNAKFFSYGSLPLTKTLAFLEEKVLKHWDAPLSQEIKIDKERRYNKPQTFQFSYPLSKKESDKEAYQIALNWLTCPIKDSDEVLALSLLSSILLGNLASPLRYKLIESNYGKDLADTTGYAEEYSETVFSVGLKGVAKKNLQKVENLILDTLKEIVTKKIDVSFIESAIHQKEISIRKIKEPYGLHLFLNIVAAWMNSGNIIKTLNFDEQIEKIKNRVKKENYFENLIQKYLIDNLHRVRVEMHPSKDYMEKQEKEINHKIQKKAAAILKQKATIPQKEDLKTTTENIECLPSLDLDEIIIKIPRIAKKQKKGIDIYQQPTNGLEYWSLHLENPKVNFENLWQFPLVCSMLTKIGTKKHSYEEFSALINRYTGGLNFSSLCVERLDGENYHQLVWVSAKSLNNNKKKMQGLLEEALLEYSFSNSKRIQQWISEITLAKTESVAAQGLVYATGLANRYFSKTFKLEEDQGGIHSFKKFKKFQKFKSSDWQELAQNYQKSWQEFLEQATISFFVAGDQIADTAPIFSEMARKFQFPIKENWDIHSNLLAEKSPSRPIREIWQTSSVAISYVVRSYPTVDYQHPDSPKLLVLSRILQGGFIHQEIREKGGAYGGLVSFQKTSGIFSFLSYRDPRLLETWEVYQKAIDWVLQGNFSELQVKDAILQTFGNLDKPLPPAGLAANDFLKKKLGESLEIYENYRKKIRAIQKQDLIQVAEKWLTQSNYIDVAISSEEIVKNIKKLDSGIALYNI